MNAAALVRGKNCGYLAGTSFTHVSLGISHGSLVCVRGRFVSASNQLLKERLRAGAIPTASTFWAWVSVGSERVGSCMGSKSQSHFVTAVR